MFVNFVSNLLIIASVSSVTTSRNTLKSDPVLGGSLIKFCEKEFPKNCQTIDRRKEKSPDLEYAEAIEAIGTKLAEASSDFSSLSYDNKELKFFLSVKQSK